MAKNFKRALSLFLVALTCAGMLSTAALAQTTLDNGNIWHGDKVKLDVEEGTDGYTYMLFGDITDDGNKANDYYYYETSNHVLTKAGGGAVHLIALIDTAKYHGDWTPDGVYNCSESNFDVVYCCDAATGSEAGDYYKRLNLEDSEYFTVEEAKKLRAILENSYPFVSVEEAKAALKEADFEQADELDRSELITATQAAVWTIANAGIGDTYVYNKTASTPQKNTWGGYLHDFSNEPKNFTDSTSKVYTTPAGVGDRINALRDFLLALHGVEAKDDQIVISHIGLANPESAQSDDLYTVEVDVTLNHGADENDNIVLNVYVDGKLTGEPVQVGKATNYTITLNASAAADIKVVVSGTQNLERGVYFYAPKPQDIDGDGIATSREVSQNLIGVASGDTPIYAEASIRFDKVSFDSGKVSNISYMFINKETGEVEFLKKIDVDEGATSAPILSIDGYVSVMFMKQATSGMFWFSEEVSEDLENAAIECLKDNNPSYKGHNAIAYGFGSHELEFKKNKFATYTFGAEEVIVGDEEVKADASTDPATSEEPVVEETIVTNDATEKKNNGNNKNKNKNKNK